MDLGKAAFEIAKSYQGVVIESTFPNVKRDFSAVGNGISNDKSSLQNAINSLAATGGTIYLPPGIYGILSGLSFTSNNVKFVGSGKGTVIKPLAGFSGTSVFNTACIDSCIQNLKIDLSDAATIAVNCANGTKNLSLDGIYFKKGQQKLTINNGSGGTVENVTVTDCDFDNGGDPAGYGILVNTQANGKGLIVQGCRFFGDASDYIEINVPLSFSDVTIIGNIFKDLTNVGSTSGFAIGLAKVKNVTITGNTFSRIYNQAVHVEDESSAITITGNTFRDCGSSDDGTYSGKVINVINECSDIVISLNALFGKNRKGTGINLEAGGAFPNVSRYSLVGNIIRGFSIGIQNVEQPWGTYSSNMIFDCVKGFRLFKPYGQTFTANQVHGSDYGFDVAGFGSEVSYFDRKLGFVNNLIGTDVTTPFAIDETASFIMGRIVIGNQGIPAKTFVNSTATDVAGLRSDLNLLLDWLRSQKS